MAAGVGGGAINDERLHLQLSGVISVCGGAPESQFPFQEICIMEIRHNPELSSALRWLSLAPVLHGLSQYPRCLGGQGCNMPRETHSCHFHALVPSGYHQRQRDVAPCKQRVPKGSEPPTTLLCSPSAREVVQPTSLLSLAEISLSLSVSIPSPGTRPARSMLLFTHQSFHQNMVIYTVIYTEQHPHGLPRQRTNYQIICEF